MLGEQLALHVSPPPPAEAAKRDAILDQHEASAPDLIAEGRRFALFLANTRGRVTSTQVLEWLRLTYPVAMQGRDPRFLGAVFRRSRGWKRVGWDGSGSHGRPVAVWARATEVGHG